MNGKGFFSYENKLLVLLSFMLGFVFFDRMALSYLVPFFDKELELNNTKIGLLNSMLALAWAVSGFITGYWSDRNARRKKLLLVAVLIFSICSFFSGMAGSFGWLLIARVIMGAAAGPVIPLSQSIILSYGNEKRRGFNMGFVQGFVTSILATSAPLLLVTIASRYGWRNGFFMAGVPGLVLAGLGYFLIKETSYKPVTDTSHQSKNGIILGYRNIRLSILIGGCMMIWLFAQTSFLPKYLVAVKHFSSTDMGIIMTCFGGAGVFWGIALPWLSDKLGRKPVLALATLMSIVMPLGLVFSGNIISHVITFVVAGSAVLGTLPIALTIIPSESVPRAFAAQTIGLVVGLAEITGGFIAPALAGMAADKFGMPSVFYIAAGAVFTASIVTCFLMETAPIILSKKRK